MAEAVREALPLRARSGLVCAEIIGLPGTGKTSLIERLERRGAPIRFVDTYMRIDRTPAFLQSAAAVAPLLARTSAFSIKERIAMVRLQASPQLIATEGWPIRFPLVFDQGPLFDLLVVKRAAERRGSNGRFDEWWRRSLETWCRTLHLVVWLDAPDDVLVERIRARQKAHKLQDLDDETTRAVLQRERADWRGLVAAMSRPGGPRVLRFDTQRDSLDEIAQRSLMDLEAAR